MTIKKKQLNELIKLITRQILKEYGVSSIEYDSSGDDAGAVSSSSDKPEDAKTAVEKAKERRKRLAQNHDDMERKSKELKSKKDEVEFQKQKLDYLKRFDIPAINKQIQAAKGAQI